MFHYNVTTFFSLSPLMMASSLFFLEQKADVETLKKLLEEARAESIRLRDHYKKKLAQERKATDDVRAACEKLEKQNAELKKRLHTINAANFAEFSASDDAKQSSESAASAKDTDDGKPPLPPSVLGQASANSVLCSPMRMRAQSVSESRHTRKGSSALTSSALSQFTHKP